MKTPIWCNMVNDKEHENENLTLAMAYLEEAYKRVQAAIDIDKINSQETRDSLQFIRNAQKVLTSRELTFYMANFYER